ncbi:FAD-dependent oxidoreductase [Pseudotabrizicola formosa]|uniref:FAD-dependent oxidoreductase n=1 Tax=Pseudotabrizicola formosa TaxID=2030009 RepID=UPI000CD1811C|nr:FAD-dependent oxidoreductase [Pseudotabrizicola formosa]
MILPPVAHEARVQTLIVGAGACGLIAALAAQEAGQEVLVLERDAVPWGSTALSAGLIPAAGTRWQAAAGITDSPAQFAADIAAKAHHENDPALEAALTTGAAQVLHWLADRHGLELSVITDFTYPGHSARRMHGLPSRSGLALVNALRAATEAMGIDILTEAQVTALYADGARVTGVQITRPDGSADSIGCDRLILACNGFGGNKAMVAQHMPAIADALYFGHPGNQGEAMTWGAALGAAVRHAGAYQGHGNVAHPHGILITWATIMEGGCQVNLQGKRFWNEAQGYSEAACAVLAQPEGLAWAIFDARIAGVARQFQDFRDAEAQGAVKTAPTVAALAQATGLPPDALANTLAAFEAAKTGAPDGFGRALAGVSSLTAPFVAVRVTGALFHTQGGLVTDGQGRVLSAQGKPLGNLWAGGGAACGVSGSGDAGYLSGNGLLSAVVLGYRAGRGDETSSAA